MLAFRGEIRGGIYGACNNHKSCYGAGASAYAITSAIVNCCNEDEECYNANETTLPVACDRTYSPWGTFSPTLSSSPTTATPDLLSSSLSPTKSPIDNFASKSPTLLVPNSVAVQAFNQQISATAMLLGFVVVLLGE